MDILIPAKNPYKDPYHQGNAPDAGGLTKEIFCKDNPDHPMCTMTPKEYSEYEISLRNN